MMITKQNAPIFLNKTTYKMTDLQLVGETQPYLFGLNELKIDGTVVEHKSCLTNKSQFSEFNKTLQTASSLGSLSLIKLMNTTAKTFFLGEKLRIRKIHDNIQGDELKYVAKSIMLSKRKGKSLVDIFDSNNELVYTFELDYNLFSEDAFNKLFKKHYIDELQQEADTVFPETEITIIDDATFRASIAAFSDEHCLGHFDNYPIVPAVFIVNRLLDAIEKFFSIGNEKTSNKNLIVDSLEIFANIAIPTKTDLISVISFRELAKNVFLFSCPVSDGVTEFGTYIITVKLSN